MKTWAVAAIWGGALLTVCITVVLCVWISASYQYAAAVYTANSPYQNAVWIDQYAAQKTTAKQFLFR